MAIREEPRRVDVTFGDAYSIAWSCTIAEPDSPWFGVSNVGQALDALCPYVRDDWMYWGGDWVSGRVYPKNYQVRDGDWLMVSNKETSQKPGPYPVGDEFYLYQGTLTNTQVTAKQVIFGQRYEFQTGGYINGYRINTVAGNEYTVFTVFDPLGVKEVTQIAQFTASTSGFTEFNLISRPVSQGTAFDLVVLTSEPDPMPSTFTGNWDYSTPFISDPDPSAGEIVHSNLSTGTIKVSKTDNDGGDRSVELSTIEVGDKIRSAQIEWAVQSIQDNGAFITFGIAPAQQLPSDGVQEFSFDVTVATPITYGEDVDFWIPVPGVQGLLGIDTDYDSIVPDQTAYGADLLVQAAYIPTDWDLASYSGGSAGVAPTPEETIFFSGSSFVDQPIPATDLGAVVEVEVINGVNGIGYTSGEFTVNDSGFLYNIAIELNLGIDAGFTGAIQTWAEILDDDGVTWVPSTTSLRSKDFTAFSEGVIRYVQVAPVTAPTSFRVKIRSVGGVAQSLDSVSTTVGGNPIQSPSVTVSITKGGAIPTGMMNDFNQMDFLSGDFS